MSQGRFIPIRKVPVASLQIGFPEKPALIAGPCVIENESVAMAVAEKTAELAALHGFNYIFKASFDKANRTSIDSYRGPGMKEGLRILAEVKKKLRVPVLTDVHEKNQVGKVAEIVDIIQVPAFLCRQTDLVVAAAASGRVVNLKKGQFISPEEMRSVVEKAESTNNKKLLITERGTFFGYGRLVVDMTGMVKMRAFGYPVIFDATHSAQRPGALGHSSGGDRQSAKVLARAAAAAGCDGIFIEVHPEPDKALSDKSTSLDFKMAEILLEETAAVFNAIGRFQIGH